MGRDVDLTGALTLNSGDIAAGANTLTVAEASITSGIGDVWGNVKRTGPLVTGKSYRFGNPNVALNFAAGGTLPADITVNLAHGAPSGSANAVSRTYTITPNGGSDYSATVRLRYLAGELGANSESQLHLWRYDGVTWQDQGQSSIGTNARWVEVTGVTAFSLWAVAGGTLTAITLRTLSAASQSTATLPIVGLTLLGGLAALSRRRRG